MIYEGGNMDKEMQLMFQKKVPGKYTFDRPDYVDITVGGHLKSGESFEDGIRELREETGLLASVSDLVSLGIRQNTFSAENKYFAYEYQHIFLYNTKCNLSDFAIDEKEVNGFVEVDIDELIELLLGSRKDIISKHGFMIDGKYCEKDFIMTLSDIIPSYLKGDKIMLRLAIAAKRYCKGEELELLFW